VYVKQGCNGPNKEVILVVLPPNPEGLSQNELAPVGTINIKTAYPMTDPSTHAKFRFIVGTANPFIHPLSTANVADTLDAHFRHGTRLGLPTGRSWPVYVSSMAHRSTNKEWTLSHYSGLSSPAITAKYLQDRGFIVETRLG